jgi:hypothetical protein
MNLAATVSGGPLPSQRPHFSCRMSFHHRRDRELWRREWPEMYEHFTIFHNTMTFFDPILNFHAGLKNPSIDVPFLDQFFPLLISNIQSLTSSVR